jgi:hypothetical protein
MAAQRIEAMEVLGVEKGDEGMLANVGKMPMAFPRFI